MSDLTITQARRLRHKERQARLYVLQEIDSFEKSRCVNCRNRIGVRMSAKRYRCECFAAVEIRRLAAYLDPGVMKS